MLTTLAIGSNECRRWTGGVDKFASGDNDDDDDAVVVARRNPARLLPAAAAAAGSSATPCKDECCAPSSPAQ